MAERKSLYERLLGDLENSSKVKQELSSGRRIGFYRLKTQLGVGNFAQVRLGLHLLTNEKVAVKIMDKTRLDDETSRLLSQEISCMERLNHVSLIKLFEVHESFSRLCLVMECAGEGNLQSRVEQDGPFSEDKARAVFAQVAGGMCYMHSSRVAHRDLKAENVFYASDTRVKIGDFGFSTPVTDNEVLTTFCGSPPYAAPELFKEQSYQGPPVDVWALGVTLYFMVTGNIPFPGTSVPQVKDSVLKGSYLPPKRVGPACRELVARLLTMAPSERPDIAAVVQDEWLKGAMTEGEVTAVTAHPDKEVLGQMRELGVPVEEDMACLLGEPRSAVAGTYRILLHRKLPCPPEPASLPGNSDSVAASVNKRSSFCAIL